MISVLGGGIAGLSAAYHSKCKGIDAIVFEQRARWGGLCDNFIIGDGFLFDYFVHLSFTKNEYVQKIFSESSEFVVHRPISYNYFNGFWLKHPAQNNLFALPVSEKVKIVKSFIEKKINDKPNNYFEWLEVQFGEYFTKNFSDLYTRKYWTISAENLTTDWLGNRFSIPTIEEILNGAFEEQKDNFFYASEMRYPLKGGYKAFIQKTADNCNIQLNKKAVLIDLKNKKIEFDDNTAHYYDNLCSSIPLTELVKIIKDCPKDVLEASLALSYTSGQLVSIGFNRPDVPKSLWFYIYDEDILPSRAYSPSMKSHFNVPSGCSSLQFETYFSKYTSPKLIDSNLVDHIIEKGEKMNLFTKNDILVSDYREVKYANILFDKERKKALVKINEFLVSNNIFTCGRFGEWEYYWSDQSFMSGKNVVESIIA